MTITDAQQTEIMHRLEELAPSELIKLGQNMAFNDVIGSGELHVYDMDTFNEFMSGLTPLEIAEYVLNGNAYGTSEPFYTNVEYFRINEAGTYESMKDTDVMDLYLENIQTITDVVVDLAETNALYHLGETAVDIIVENGVLDGIVNEDEYEDE